MVEKATMTTLPIQKTASSENVLPLLWRPVPETLPPFTDGLWSDDIWLALSDGRVARGQVMAKSTESAHPNPVHAWFADDEQVEEADVVAWMPFASPDHPRLTITTTQQAVPTDHLCETMQRPVAECGCPDCGSSLIDWPVPEAPTPTPAVHELTTEDAAYQMGATGADPSEHERLLFEAWMRGHCWSVCGEWNGKTYVAANEGGKHVDHSAMLTRQLWAAWRDRAALAGKKAAEQLDTIKLSRADAEVIASFFETGGSILLVDAGYRIAHRLRVLLGKEGV